MPVSRQDAVRIRNQLKREYQTLRPLEKIVLHLYALVDGLVSSMRLTRTLREPPFNRAVQTDPKVELQEAVARLEQVGFLQYGLLERTPRVHPFFIEVAARSAFKDPPPVDVDRAVYAQALREKAQALWPLHHVFMPPQGRPFTGKALRIVRLGLCAHDPSLIAAARKEAEDERTFRAALAEVCNTPFDGRWFDTLDPDIQLDALEAMGERAVTFLDDDTEALQHAMSATWLQGLEPERSSKAAAILAPRLILAGRMRKVQKLLPALQDATRRGILNAWIQWVQGHPEGGLSLAREKGSGSEGVLVETVRGISGLFFLLAFLSRPGTDPKDVLNRWPIREILKKTVAPDPWEAPARALLAAVHLSRMETDRAERGLEKARTVCQTPWGDYCCALVEYWNRGALSDRVIERVSEIFIQSKQAQVHWLAMESAELLCRAERVTPVRSNYLGEIARRSGLRSLFEILTLHEPWRRNLNALRRIIREESQEVEEKRLVWFLSFSGTALNVEPRIQTRRRDGTWSLGRRVSLKRLYEDFDLVPLDRHDQRILSTLEEVRSGFSNPGYAFRQPDLSLALVGHPRLFNAQQPEHRVEVTAEDPHLLVESGPEGFHIHLWPRVKGRRALVLRESPTRYTAVRFSKKHQEIAAVIGPSGLHVPESAAGELKEILGELARHVAVHSPFSPTDESIPRSEADPTPHVHLLPARGGLRAELLVKPLGEDGPYLEPGQGGEVLMVERNGARLQARRDLAAERRKAQRVVQECFTPWAESQDDLFQWSVSEPASCLEILEKLKELQDQGQVVVFWPEGETFRLVRTVSPGDLQLFLHGRFNWFELEGRLQVTEDQVLDLQAVLDQMRRRRDRFLPIGESEYVALSRELAKQLQDMDAFTQERGKSLRMHPFGALALKDSGALGEKVHLDEKVHEKIRNLERAMRSTPALPSTLRADLRDYQVEGFQWLARLSDLGIGACLADDMGLGKTLQALAVILYRSSEGPSLVVAPTSVCMNWVEEARRFAPTLQVHVFGGNHRKDLVQGLAEGDLLVCSYGLMQQEIRLLEDVEWQTVVLDEAQAIKNAATKRAQAAMKLRGRFKMATTGTPLENRLEELHSLFQFINPGLLGSRAGFRRRFVLPIEKHRDGAARRRLQKLIRPFVLRRTKAQVLEELPPRTEITLQVELSKREAAFYEALRRDALSRLEEERAGRGLTHVQIFAELMRLRQACCHPRLIDSRFSAPSAKMRLLDGLLEDLLPSGHKALIFSQFVRFLQIIRHHLDAKGIQYRYLDGSTPPKEREREVRAFQEGRGDLFLISLKAGGFGLNLTAADYVIHMDPWWNPAVEDQASNRVHRIGQDRPVTVYRLITEGTIEEKVIQLHREKRALADTVLAGTDTAGIVSAEELLALLRDD
ncbi:Superfamily II DNA or RNA helicase, SNF2 family [Desulfacinum hydrothermale DSM 13146]|uniref:Superfamily II DNA or RNA helicase, SNF2 family n=1 Tax=Desulfacinum hydrothermale DSM 13146 TaxID=1121390 RepID=A0A1W1XKS0_9BACT|nr:DEAD/DEAH box helicase [Desulfacinum hydrothermale]SMC24569.1 Superfamily II DNA or RNA helicase, SNF2 family [Desulfacinum hydrothermale DSM 13146]